MNSYPLNVNSNHAFYSDIIPLNTCVFCGNQYGNTHFKGKCVCEDCLEFVKELM